VRFQAHAHHIGPQIEGSSHTKSLVIIRIKGEKSTLSLGAKEVHHSRPAEEFDVQVIGGVVNMALCEW
jgi:hypothetical protein